VSKGSQVLMMPGVALEHLLLSTADLLLQEPKEGQSLLVPF
jgi:hypothetical protein